jgi:hypothetical protein
MPKKTKRPLVSCSRASNALNHLASIGMTIIYYPYIVTAVLNLYLGLAETPLHATTLD